MSNGDYGYYQQPLPPPLPPELPPRKEDGVGKYVLLIGGGCLLLLLFAGTVGFFVYYIFHATADPLKVVNLQLDALRQNDFEKAYSYCSSGFKQITNYESFQSFVNGNPLLKNSKEFTSLKREIENGTAKLKGNLVGIQGTTQPVEYHLVQEGRVWKVQYIDLSSAGTTQETKKESSEPRRDLMPVPEEPHRDNPSEPSRDQVDTTSLNNLRIQEIQSQQQPDGDLMIVTLSFKVFGFKNDTTGRTPRIHVVQDLKTYDPNGNLIPDLSKDAIKDFEDYGNFEYVSMSNTLKIPSSYARGTYRSEFTVHDQIGNTTTASSTQFVLQ